MFRKEGRKEEHDQEVKKEGRECSERKEERKGMFRKGMFRKGMFRKGRESRPCSGRKGTKEDDVQDERKAEHDQEGEKEGMDDTGAGG
jgi:hypothetical protein